MNNELFSTEKKIVDHNSFWTILNNENVAIKLNSHSLEELTNDKKEEVQRFIKSKKINPRSEDDFAAALTYYNSISNVK